MTKFQFFLLVILLTAFTFGSVFTSFAGENGISDSDSQQMRVTGKVTDAATGEPMLGVTVVVKGTTIGQITDFNGNYSINIPQQEVTLVFSSIGYAMQEIRASAGAVLNVSMSLDILEMDEVVVVGYGVQKKESVLASISQATGEEIMTNLRGADLTNALSGALPGLVTVQVSGIPGGSGAENPATQIFIRGRNTWNNSQPLIMVDGVEREMNDVDPYTVERISILKDASATAVFGVKGANGVILITTKRGQIGRPKLSLNVTSTGKAVSRIQSPVGSYTALKHKNYAIINQLPIAEQSWVEMVPEELLGYYRDQTYPDYLPDVNWTKESLKDITLDRNVNLSVSGGTKFVKYFGSLSYLFEDDILKIQDTGQGYSPNFNFHRYNFQNNLDFTVTSSTEFSVNLRGFLSDQQRPRQGLIQQEWFALYRYPPDLIPVRYSDGIWAEFPLDERFTNQLMDANLTGYTLNKVGSVSTDFQLKQDLNFILKGLRAHGKFSYDIRANTNGPNLIDGGTLAKYISPAIMNEIQPGMTQEEIKEIERSYTTWITPSSGSSGFDFVPNPFTYGAENAQNNIYRSINYEMALNYSRVFGKHTVGGLFLFKRNENAVGSVIPIYTEDWVGRLNYEFGGRYLFEVNGAYNGSEQFGYDYRFGFFPSVSMGWIISNESFFQPLTSVVNLLKARFTSGKVGNDSFYNANQRYDNDKRWLYTSSWEIANNSWQFGSPTMVNSIYPYRFQTNIANPNVQWETSEKKDLGIETSLFQNLININWNYFWGHTTNIFVPSAQRVFPDYFGAAPVSGNIGETKSNGWEIESDISKRFSNGLHLRAGFAWAFADSRIIKKSDPELAPDYQKEAGYRINQPRVHINTEMINDWNDVYTGVLGQTRNFVLPGVFRTNDFNSDGVISPEDAAPYGYPARAQYTYAPKIGASFKGVSLDVNFYGVYNTEGQEPQGIMGAFQFQKSLLWDFQVNQAWSPEMGVGKDAKYNAPRLGSGDGGGGPVFVSRSFFRLKSAILSYTLPKSLTNKVGLSSMRVFANGENLFLWSDMLTDADSDNAASRRYPIQKRVTMGLNVNF
jgi:TonB-linked SusC/RagA family outer membrane protein